MTDQPKLLVRKEGAVTVFLLNRPEVRNAVDRELSLMIADAVDAFDRDETVRVGILAGTGPTFCSGMDLKAFLRGESARLEGRGFAGIVEHPPKKPMIAAVEGVALAGGFELALACDLIVAGDTVRMGLPEVRRGLVANAGGLVRLPSQIPTRIATELILTGEPMTAQRLAEHGLINRVVPAGTALEAARNLARVIAANGPLALMASKRVIREARDWPVEELFVRQREITDAVFASDDAKEGARAFAEKREPRWQGR